MVVPWAPFFGASAQALLCCVNYMKWNDATRSRMWGFHRIEVYGSANTMGHEDRISLPASLPGYVTPSVVPP